MHREHVKISSRVRGRKQSNKAVNKNLDVLIRPHKISVDLITVEVKFFANYSKFYLYFLSLHTE